MAEIFKFNIIHIKCNSHPLRLLSNVSTGDIGEIRQILLSSLNDLKTTIDLLNMTLISSELVCISEGFQTNIQNIYNQWYIYCYKDFLEIRIYIR